MSAKSDTELESLLADDKVKEALEELAAVVKRRQARESYGRIELHLHQSAGAIGHWAIVEVTSVK